MSDDGKYSVEIEERGEGLFVGIVYFWQPGYSAPEKIGETKPRGMRPDVTEEAKDVARRHRQPKERIDLDLDD